MGSARKNIGRTHRGDDSNKNEIISCDQETVESVKKTTVNPYRRKDGCFSTKPYSVTQTRSKGRAKLRDTVVESSTDGNKVSYKGRELGAEVGGDYEGGISAVRGRDSQTGISC